ncbi:MAG: FAD-binding protein, partial [Gammaproteobacteria bacterium]
MITLPHASERIRHRIEKSELIRKFGAFLPESAVLSEEEELVPYECDGLAAYRCKPWLAVLPETVEQVQGVLRLCYDKGVPVVARGAGTGLAGGALPLDNGVLLSLARFNRILRLDAANRMAVVQPGVRNLAVSQAAAPYGLYYAPDPSSQIACSIGGNVAENSGGVHCLKYGLTTHNIFRLKMVTMEGEIVTIGSHGPDSPGYDLLALMAGSEGMLGVIVEVTVKLLPVPERARVVLAAFASVAKAADAVAGIIAGGLIPAGLEMMDQAAIRAAEDFVHAGYPVDAKAILLCEVDGGEEQVEEELKVAVGLLKSFGAEGIRISGSDKERLALWSGRKSAFPAVGRLSPDYYCMDGTIPRRSVSAVLKEISRLSE